MSVTCTTQMMSLLAVSVVSTKQKMYLNLSACMCDPVCNRDLASISTSFFYPSPALYLACVQDQLQWEILQYTAFYSIRLQVLSL